MTPVGDRIVTTPADDARHAFDGANNVEPARTIAVRIAAQYGVDQFHPLVDDIAQAIDDADDRAAGRVEFVAARLKALS